MNRLTDFDALGSSLMNRSPAAVADIVLLAPFSGPVVPLEAVPDPVFSGGIFGDGIGIDPLSNVLLAPCDGTVTHLARTSHALTIQTIAGAEILVHIGIDTVELHGKGFTAKIAEGAQVRAGQPLMEFDADFVARHAPSLVSVIAVANGDAFDVVERAGRGMVHAGKSMLLKLRAKGSASEPAAAAAGDTAASAGAAAQPCARASLKLTHAGGLHARPAARAREAARAFAAQVEVHYEGRKAPIQSVVGLLGLGAGEGSSVELVATGDDAQAALDAVLAELQGAGQESVEETPARALSPAPARAASTAGHGLDPNTLAGVCAAPGIALGTLVRWDDAPIDPPERASGTPAAESRLLDKALASVDAELSRTVRDASQRGAVGEAGIFAVHRVLLEDPTLVDAARDLISLGKSAGHAWREALRAQAATLTALGDPLLAERASDLRDIEKRVLRCLGYAPGTTRELPSEAVLAADEFTPSDLSGLDRQRVSALVMARGGATSHAAIIARQLGIPALVALGDALFAVPDGTQVVVDATGGRLAYAPTQHEVESARLERQRLADAREANRRTSQRAATTGDGRTIEVAANIATLEDARAAVDNGADAVGLLRTELMFIHRQHAPTVAEHTQSYQGIADALAGRAAIIRTIDIGADKQVDFLTLPPEANPALGMRGVRLAQLRPDLLDDQLRGLLAVKPVGAVRILLPMVTDVGELRRIRKRIDELSRDIGRVEPIEVGVMVEVPSAALLADQLSAHADFLSIGTNDLTQYTLAMDRCQADLAAQADGLHPAVLRLIDTTVHGAARHGKWVGVCGALAGDPIAVPLLVGLGVTELSVDPVAVPAIKARVRRLDYQLCRQRARDALALDSAQAVRAASREIWPLD